MPYKTFSTLNNKSYPSELTELSVINRQFAKQKQYEGWELAGSSRPYFIDFAFLKRNGYHHPDDDKSHCGRWVIYGCINVSKHKNNLLTDNPNPVFFKPNQYNCHRLRCAECYHREAHFASVRIARRIRYFRQTNEFYSSADPLMETHVIVSPRVEIQDTYNSIRSRVVKLLQDVGVVGGVLIVHHFRCEDKKYDKLENDIKNIDNLISRKPYDHRLIEKKLINIKKKRLMLGIVDDEGDVTYYEVRWMRP